MSDQQFLQSPATVQPSAPVGSVAPPPVAQAYEQVPGSGQPPQQAQPGQQPQQPATPPTPSGPSVEDIQRQLDQERSERLRAQQEINQFRGAFQQLQGAAQEQERSRQFDQRMQVVLAAAANMNQAEADNYIKQQSRAILSEQQQAIQQQAQQQIQQANMVAQQAAAPQYAAYLAQQLGLSDRGRDRLVSLGDPNLMYQQAQAIKADEDYYGAQLAQFQQGQVQQGRTQEVLAMQNAGLGAIGGQQTGTFQVDIPDNLSADERAIQIYNYTKYGPGWNPNQR